MPGDSHAELMVGYFGRWFNLKAAYAEGVGWCVESRAWGGVQASAMKEFRAISVGGGTPCWPPTAAAFPPASIPERESRLYICWDVCSDEGADAASGVRRFSRSCRSAG